MATIRTARPRHFPLSYQEIGAGRSLADGGMGANRNDEIEDRIQAEA